MTRKKTDLDHIDKFHEYGIYIPTRTIRLDLDEGDAEASDVSIGPISENKLIKNLTILESINHDPIKILMNCPGGNIVDGLAMYDLIRSCNSHITIQVLGEAASMGVWVLQAADQREMFPFSRLMLHDGSMAVEGNAVDVEKTVEHEKYWRLKLYKLLEERTGQKASYWKRKMANDWYLTAEQALAEKLIDRIIT